MAEIAGATMNKEIESMTDRRTVLGLTTATLAGALTGCAYAPATVTAASQSRQRFRGKTVLITGATSGIGRAAAVQFAAEGGNVAFCGRRENLGREAEQLIRSAGGEATYIRADVRDESQLKAFVDRAVRKYGKPRRGIQQCGNHFGKAAA
jgi:NADPH:quinone reductase-like Zn-dependent oxidoreductase